MDAPAPLGYRRDPILKTLHHIENRDALLDLSRPGEAERGGVARG